MLNEFFILSGIVIAFLRYLEPYVKLTIFSCLSKENEKKHFVQNSMISLVHQSKNIEYVYLMLLGATEYLQNFDNIGDNEIEINRKNG